MIAFANKNESADRNDKFEEFLPRIRRYAQMAFRDEPAERKEELVAEVVANAFIAFDRLVKRGITNVAYATPLGLYAIKQVRMGRRVGSRLNANDLLSPYAQHRKCFVVERLVESDDENNLSWREILVEDRKAGPAEIAANRIDFDTWLHTLPKRRRQIAETLATGEKTNHVAKQFKVSAGRISQVRQELLGSWNEFHGAAVMGS